MKEFSGKAVFQSLDLPADIGTEESRRLAAAVKLSVSATATNSVTPSQLAIITPE